MKNEASDPPKGATPQASASEQKLIDEGANRKLARPDRSIQAPKSVSMLNSRDQIVDEACLTPHENRKCGMTTESDPAKQSTQNPPPTQPSISQEKPTAPKPDRKVVAPKPTYITEDFDPARLKKR
jgi:hypothetical protein